jgi:hypothetical protein
MTTESEVLLARYAQVEREGDEFGRVIGVRRLRPSEQSRLSGMTQELGGFEEVRNPETGESNKIPQRSPLMVAASVCEIDGTKIPFPRNRNELDAIYNRLDMEGIKAATLGYLRLYPQLKDDGDEVEEPLDRAKNLSGTPSSG